MEEIIQCDPDFKRRCQKAAMISRTILAEVIASLPPGEEASLEVPLGDQLHSYEEANHYLMYHDAQYLSVVPPTVTNLAVSMWLEPPTALFYIKKSTATLFLYESTD